MFYKLLQNPPVSPNSVRRSIALLDFIAAFESVSLLIPSFALLRKSRLGWSISSRCQALRVLISLYKSVTGKTRILSMLFVTTSKLSS